MANVNVPATPTGIMEALVAGQATVQIANRSRDIAVVVDGRVVQVPVILDAAGNPMVPRDLIAVASQMAEAMGPRRQGSYSFSDLASLIAWTKRYVTKETVAFFRAPSLSAERGMIAVRFDELPVGASAGASRRLLASLEIELHQSLQTWVDYADKWLAAETFCEHVDAHSDDLTTADVVSLIRNVDVREEAVWKRTSDDNGNVKIVAENNSGPTTKVPKTFAIAVPTFAFDDEQNIAIYTLSLRCKVEKGKPVFKFEFTNLERRLDECLRVAMSTFNEALPEVPTFLGRG